jgi:hypothetical protein
LDNDVLSIQVYERAIRYFKENKLPGVIVDMRHNGGGSGWLANQMAAYFFSREIETGYVEHYDPTIGDFYAEPGEMTPMIPPPADLQFAGPVAVLVGQGCASACEFFSYDMTINGRRDGLLKIFCRKITPNSRKSQALQHGRLQIVVQKVARRSAQVGTSSLIELSQYPAVSDDRREGPCESRRSRSRCRCPCSAYDARAGSRAP